MKIFFKILIYFVLGLISEIFLMWLFPYTGLAGIVSWIFFFILTIVFSILYIYIYKKTKSKLILIISLLILLLTQFVIELVNHPQDYGGSPIEQIKEYNKALIRLKEINYEDFPNLNSKEKILHLAKFEDKLPEKLIVIEIYDLDSSDNFVGKSRNYLIEINGDKKRFNKNKIELIEKSDQIELIEKINNKRHHFNSKFLKGGWGFKSEKCDVYINSYDYKLNTGIEKIYYGLAKLRRNTSK